MSRRILHIVRSAAFDRSLVGPEDLVVFATQTHSRQRCLDDIGDDRDRDDGMWHRESSSKSNEDVWHRDPSASGGESTTPEVVDSHTLCELMLLHYDSVIVW